MATAARLKALNIGWIRIKDTLLDLRSRAVRTISSSQLWRRRTIPSLQELQSLALSLPPSIRSWISTLSSSSSSSASSSSSVRGVAMAPRLLLLTLLILQLVILVALRAVPSSSAMWKAHKAKSSATTIYRELYSVPLQHHQKTSLRRAFLDGGGTTTANSLSNSQVSNSSSADSQLSTSSSKDSSISEDASQQHASTDPSTFSEDSSKHSSTSSEDPATRSHHSSTSSDDPSTISEDSSASSQISSAISEDSSTVSEDSSGSSSLTGSEDSSAIRSESSATSSEESSLLAEDSSTSEDSSEERRRFQDSSISEESNAGSKESEEEFLLREEESKAAAAAEERRISSIEEEDPICKGSRIFVYDLPSMFNADLVANCSTLNPWVSLCDQLSNSGMGKKMENPPWPAAKNSWYLTDQFSGEVIFHNRILTHPCITNHSDTANLFYIPYYAGLDASRYLWKSSAVEERDDLAKNLFKWLMKSSSSSSPSYFSRNGGTDHFIMIGRITWDFRRSDGQDWGSSFLKLPQVKNITRLIIERNPWENGEYGVPYPTSFHPANDGEIEEWQKFLRSKKRSLTFAFAGAKRDRIAGDFREVMLSQCEGAADGACAWINCAESKCEGERHSSTVMELFLNSTFCLQPRGDSYSRRSIFDALISGCIPVFFWNQSSYWQYGMFFGTDDSEYSVFIDRKDVRRGEKNILTALLEIPSYKVAKMRDAVIDLIPKIVYSSGGLQRYKDAFDIAVDGVLKMKLRKPILS